MQDEVNQMFFNALADGRKSGSRVGSLVPEFRSAWRASARQLERPSRRIAFLLSEQGVSVIDPGDCPGGGLRCCCGRRYLFPVARQARVEDRISIPGVGAQSPLFPARSAARCRSQSSRTRSAAAETPIFPAAPLSGDRLALSRRLSVFQSGSTEGCGCNSWAILKTVLPLPGLFHPSRQNRAATPEATGE